MAPQRILFLTHCEQGQSNVQLATAFEIHSRAVPGLEVHFASFAELRKRFERMRVAAGDDQERLTFHTIAGVTQFGAMARVGAAMGTDFRHAPMFDLWPKFANMMVPWTPEEYMAIVDEILSVIEAVDPNLIIVDTLFGQAVDACNLAHRQYHVLSPILPSIVCVQNQSLAHQLLRYPLCGTGLPYPLTLTSIPLNLANIAAMLYHGMRSPQLKGVNAARVARGCSSLYPGLDCMRVSPERIYITPGVREVDVPFVKPPTLRLCGPISADFASIRESDPALASWLDRGETVLMIMGTHFDYDEPLARRVLTGLLGGVDAGTQILWKVPNRKELDVVFDELLTTTRDRERVRAVTWFDSEPASILEHENVVCYIHHGGANSYYECARAGKPQIVLPQWADTYYNATTAEYAGLGVYGNQTCAPDVDAKELSVALTRVTSGQEGARFRERAREVGVKCREAGGRKRAADIVLALLNDSVEKA
ncbi:glycosyltransferase family 1 protein [Schizophyllum amplum]|uniref:Glycosyltransferase family 1 protein n=1 Tax=Schizophyllum amplum TaxID=97359 RepID=A0A550CV35_9AGAR|nr:glycosyltransferase family 1 protein [Auriculariopsis ampla]